MTARAPSWRTKGQAMMTVTLNLDFEILPNAEMRFA